MLLDLAGITHGASAEATSGNGGGSCGGILPTSTEWDSIDRIFALLSKIAEAEDGFEFGFRRSRRPGAGRRPASDAQHVAATLFDAEGGGDSSMRTMPDIQNVVPELFDLQVSRIHT